MDSSINKVIKRKRVARACSLCRKKKVKCDGKEPCSNCTTSKNDCKYDELKKVNKPRKRLTNSENIHSLNSRLERLESLLENIATKIGQDQTDSMRQSGSSDHSESETGDYEDDDEGEEEDEVGDEEIQGDDAAEASTILQRDSSFTSRNPAVEEKYGKGLGNATNGSKTDRFGETTSFSIIEEKKKILGTKSLSEFFGSHSLLYIVFSDKSQEWFKEKLPAKHAKLLAPIIKFPHAIQHWGQNFTKLWKDPPILNSKQVEEVKTGSFPEYDLVFALLENVYDGIFLASYLCKGEYLKQLFSIYYKNKGIKYVNDPLVPKRKLLLSEILIMNSALSLCIVNVLDKKAAGAEQVSQLSPKVREIKNEFFFRLQEQCLSNCIFAYMRVVAFSEGLPTVQGILLFVIYLEMSSLFPQVNYMLTSMAVRVAQSIGLHRFESFQNDTEEIADLKRTVWWTCQYLDMEICYRSGKPPLINVQDVSTLTEKDTSSKIADNDDMDWLGMSHEECVELQKNMTESERKVSSGIFHNYAAYILLRLTWVRAKGYSQLFSASVDSFSPETLVSTLRELNFDIRSLAHGIHPELRPKYYNEPGFDAIPYENIFLMSSYDDCGPEYVLTFHFTYFLQIMSVNRIPFLLETESDNITSELLSYRNSALDCARTIICICIRISHKSSPLSFLHWSAFCPFTAYLVLFGNLVNHKDRGYSEDDMFDINLLIRISMLFSRYDLNTPLTINYQRDVIHDLCIRVLLKILIQVVESNSNLKIQESTPGLREHLRRPEEVFPDLYKGKVQGLSYMFDEIKYSNSVSESSSVGQSSTGDSPHSIKNQHVMDTRFYQGQPSPKTEFVGHSIYPLSHESQFEHHTPNLPHTPYNPPLLSSGSARNSPSLSNIMNPTIASSMTGSTPLQHTNNFSSVFDPFSLGYDIDETFTTMMNKMPNFFYDNNLGN
ncbi:hypothetical protein CLIB1423_03S00936 [[Candida] railenensis]|uniref:Zn(2)-C6 fungal-type domain-containing protein n=1 Tax=[Candida] railenensis TaxID=45579 RepID=A0A9P0VWE8_9ASCO|nr:hypothetical protein CLIB1423_03S00936 [[Candida] railenensis]